MKVLSLLVTLTIACANIDVDAHPRRKSVDIFVNTNDTCITVKPTTELLKAAKAAYMAMSVDILPGRVTQIEPEEEEEGLKLHKTVFLGYIDIAAAGSRALLGLEMRKEYYSINVPELSDCVTAIESPHELDPREQTFSPFQVLNCKYEQFSLIIINTVVPADKTHFVCSTIMDLCAKHCIDTLIVLSALKLDLPRKKLQDIYENPINATPVTKCPPVPPDTKICDPFLSTLIQMIQVEYIATNILVVPCHKGSLGSARYDEETQKTIIRFQETITSLTGLKFSKDFSLDLIYREDSRNDVNMTQMMYS